MNEQEFNDTVNAFEQLRKQVFDAFVTSRPKDWLTTAIKNAGPEGINSMWIDETGGLHLSGECWTNQTGGSTEFWEYLLSPEEVGISL